MLILTPKDGNEEKELKKGFVGVRLSRFINALQKKILFMLLKWLTYNKKKVRAK